METLHLSKWKKNVDDISKHINFNGITSPCEYSAFQKFSNQNPTIGLKIYQIQPNNLLSTIFESKNFTQKIHKIRLAAILIPDSNIVHLILIHNISSFLRSGKTNKIVCKYCDIASFKKIELRDNHEKICSMNKNSNTSGSNYLFPKLEIPITVLNNSVKSPPIFSGYCDFETILIPSIDESICQKCKLLCSICKCSYTQNKGSLQSISYHLLIQDNYTKSIYFEQYYCKRKMNDIDAGVHLIQTLNELKCTLFNILNKKINYDIDPETKIKFDNIKNCEVCNILFTKNPECRKTYHHNHFKNKNKVLKILCTKCNLATNQLNRELISIYFYQGNLLKNLSNP